MVNTKLIKRLDIYATLKEEMQLQQTQVHKRILIHNVSALKQCLQGLESYTKVLLGGIVSTDHSD